MDDPLSIGILTVALANPLMSAMFVLGGFLSVFGIGYGVTIGAFSDKHKDIGVFIMFLGAGIGGMPTLSMLESISGGSIFSIGCYDLKPFFATVMVSAAIFLLYRKIYYKDDASEKSDHELEKKEPSDIKADNPKTYEDPIQFGLCNTHH